MDQDANQPAGDPGKFPTASGGAGAMRRPDLPPAKRSGHGEAVGDECGVVRGSGGPCREALYEDPDDGTARCRLHCRARTRNADSLSELCPQWRMRGRKACKRHGGAARAGSVHPGYVDGRRSRWSPFVSAGRRALARQVAEGDPLDLLDDLAVARTRVAELLREADAHGTPDFGAALPLVEKARRAVSGADDESALRHLAELEGLLQAGRAVERAWDKIDDLMKSTTKMVESQRKRAIEGHKYVTAEDAMQMVNGMGLALRKAAEEILPKELANRLLTEIGSAWAEMQGVDSAEGVM